MNSKVWGRLHEEQGQMDPLCSGQERLCDPWVPACQYCALLWMIYQPVGFIYLTIDSHINTSAAWSYTKTPWSLCANIYKMAVALYSMPWKLRNTQHPASLFRTTTELKSAYMRRLQGQGQHSVTHPVSVSLFCNPSIVMHTWRSEGILLCVHSLTLPCEDSR